MLIGAGIGAGGAVLSGNDWKTGAMIGAGTAGAGSALTSNPFTTEALKAGAGGAAAGSTSMMQTLATPAMTSGATAAAGSQAMNTMNPALTNGLGQSSNPFTQFGRDASSYMGDIGSNISDFGSNIGDTVGEGFDYMNDKTGMENKDWTKMAMNQGINSMQPDPQQQIQAAPIGQGISRPNMDLTNSDGLLSSLPQANTTAYPSQEPITDLSQLTPEQIMKLKQQGLL